MNQNKIDPKYLDLLNSLGGEKNSPPSYNPHQRVVLIDGLNMFFRNFSMMNMVNSKGTHIGGLGGYLRSLGAMISTFGATSVYNIFDGPGSSSNRKNIVSEYKSGRNLNRITNWDIFDNLDEEDAAKYDQIVRLIQYLKLLPVKTVSFAKVEADDVIAVLAKHLADTYWSKVIIISSDKDFLQLVTENIKVFRPMEKKLYGPQEVLSKFNSLPSNFNIYKTLLSDSSDNVGGVKGLGDKKIQKLFPELKSQDNLGLKYIFDKSEKHLGEHIIYARILQDEDRLRKAYKVMDLDKPFIEEENVEILKKIVEENPPKLNPKYFKEIYNQDELGNMIRNLDMWLNDKFSLLQNP